MALCTLNGIRVIAATLVLPRMGAWHADVTVDTDAPLTGPVTLAFGEAGIAFQGTVFRGGPFRGTYQARVVGGAAGLSKAVAPKFYRGAPLWLVLYDLVSEIGERLSPSIDKTLLNHVVPKWCRRKGIAADALRDLLDQLGASFRVLPDGSLWVGEDTFPSVSFDHTLLSEDMGDGRLQIATETPQLLPGVTFLGLRISAVAHTVAPDRVRTEAWTEHAGSDPSAPDRLKGPLVAFVRNVTRDTDFHRRYPAKVVQQEPDGTLHLQPDSDDIPGLTGVPIRYGIPGVRARVPSGTRCTVAFEHGDPTSPVVTSFEPGALLELSFDDGHQRVAREGDGVAIGALSFAVDPTGKVLTITYSPPAPALPQITTISFPVGGLLGAGVLDLRGVINEGAEKLRA